MSSTNPYSPTGQMGSDRSGIRHVNVRPIQLLKRGHAMIRDEYWLFLGITLVGVLVGSIVPMGLLLGAMLVGVYLCYLEKERGNRVEFSTLFRGFDSFLDSFFVILAYLLASLLVVGPCTLAIMALLIGPAIAAGRAGAPPPPIEFSPLVIGLYVGMFAANFVVALPFVFAFQLIADRGLSAKAAIKVSSRGVWRNLGGVIWFLIVLSFVSLLATMMCYFPVFLLMPITFAAMFLLYRDIFGRDTETSPQPIDSPLTAQEGPLS